jgi:hypothetical protein
VARQEWRAWVVSVCGIAGEGLDRRDAAEGVRRNEAARDTADKIGVDL